MGFNSYIALIYQIACTFPAIAGIISYRHLSRGAKILAFYYVIAAIVDLTGFYLIRHGQSNIKLYHFFDPVEYFCLVYGFSYWIGSIKLTKILRYSIIVFVILSVVNSLRMPDINHYSFAALAIAYVVYVVISSIVIYNLIKSDTGGTHKNPVFWLAASLFIMSTNNVLYYTINITGQDIRLLEIFNYVHQFFNIIAFILAAIGLLIYNYIDGKVTAPEVSVYWN